MLICLFGIAQGFCVDPAVKDFVDGKKTLYSTLGHAKSKGVNFTMCYPNSWVAKEGDRPNVVQKFISDGGKGNVLGMIITKPLPASLTEDQQKSLFTEEALKDSVPDGATVISLKPTKIEGSPAGIMEYTQRAERAGNVFDVHSIIYTFCRGSTLVTLNFQVGGTPDNAAAQKEKLEQSRPLFTLMASSIIFPDKWK